MASVVSNNDGEIHAVKNSFMWILSDIPGLYVNTFTCRYFTSPVFSTRIQDVVHEWQLELQLCTDFDYLPNIMVSLVNLRKTEITVKSSCKVLRSKNEPIYFGKCEIFNFTATDYDLTYNHEDTIFLKIPDEMKSNPQIVLLCELMEDFNDENSAPVARYSKMSNDLEMLLEDGVFSDVTFKIDGRDIQAHKAILSQRNPVFKSMFKYDMVENQTNIVEIKDIEYRVFKELLRFVYADKVNEIKKIAEDLIAVADKYCTVGLKTMCEDVLIEDLSVDNVAKQLQLADLHCASKLKEECLEFIVSNPEDILNEPTYKELIISGSSLVYDIMHAFAKKVQRN